MRTWIPLLLGVVACGDNDRGNRDPIVEPFELVTQEDLSVTRMIDATDLDVGNEVTAQIAIPPEHGNAVVSGLSITYTPAPDYHGPDELALVLTDGTGDVSLIVDISVESIADVPIGDQDALAMNEDTPRTVTVGQLLANDSDADGDRLVITSVEGAVNGTVSLAFGNVTFTPAPNFNGGAMFIYNVTDGEFTSPVTVNVLVGATNDPPVAGDDAVLAQDDTPVTIPFTTLLANDTDLDADELTIFDVTAPTSGITSIDGTGITFTPAPGSTIGSATFEYDVTDGVASVRGTVTVTINTPPTAGPDLVNVAAVGPTPIFHSQILPNDDDGGDGPNALTITAANNAVGGTVTLEANTVTFTPTAGAPTLSFDYTITDGLHTDTTTVTVNLL